MNTEEKSLKLAELMEWNPTKITPLADWSFIGNESAHELWKSTIEPYAYSVDGLAQFAAILLKLPEVGAHFFGRWDKFTQECVLDHILRMNGVDIDK